MIFSAIVEMIVPYIRKNWKETVLYARNVTGITYRMKLQENRQFCMK